MLDRFNRGPTRETAGTLTFIILLLGLALVCGGPPRHRGLRRSGCRPCLICSTWTSTWRKALLFSSCCRPIDSTFPRVLETWQMDLNAGILCALGMLSRFWGESYARSHAIPEPEGLFGCFP